MRRAGFTLVEVVITSLVLTLVGGLAWTIVTADERLAGNTTAYLDAVAAAQRGLNLLQQDLGSASLSTVKCQCPTAPCPPAELSLQMDVTRGDPPTTQTTTYQRNGNQLTKSVNGDAPQVVAVGLSAFTVTCTADGLVAIDLTTIGTSYAGTRSHHVSSRVLVRS